MRLLNARLPRRLLLLAIAGAAAVGRPGVQAQEPGAGAAFDTRYEQDLVCPTPEQLRAVTPRIQDVRLDVLRGPGEPPATCFPEPLLEDYRLNGNAPRWLCHYQYEWQASQLFSNPLYFEDVSLERHGRSSCIQPVVSGAKFVKDVAILPYKMGVDLPRERTYTLGHVRPGNRAPAVREKLPWSLRGAAFQATAVTGVAHLFQ